MNYTARYDETGKITGLDIQTEHFSLSVNDGSVTIAAYQRAGFTEYDPATMLVRHLPYGIIATPTAPPPPKEK